MSNLIDQQLKRNDCGISAIKTIFNLLEVDISRDVIESEIHLDQEGARLDHIQKFFTKYGFSTQYKLLDLNSLNGNTKELTDNLPCITPIKSKVGLHYIVLESLKGNKIKVLDPSKSNSYTLSLQEFKKKAYFSSTKIAYVDLQEKLRFLVNKELTEREIFLPAEPSAKELTFLFNKLTYFSYLAENFGFKDKTAENEFLKDLVFNQDIGIIPEHFTNLRLKNEEKIQIKAPILLAINKTETSFGKVIDEGENIYMRLIKSISGIQDLWLIFISTTLIAAGITYVSVFINQILIDYVLPSYQLDTLYLFVIGVGIFYVFDMIFYAYKKFISIHLGNTLDKFFLASFDKKLNDYSIQYLQSFKRGDLTERLSDTMKLKSFFMSYFSKIFVNVIIALFSMSILLFINWQISMIVFFVLGLFMLIFYILTPIIQNLERQRFTQKAEFFSKFIEKIDGIQVIKALQLERYSSSEINGSINNLIHIQTKSKYIGLINSLSGSLITMVASLLIIALTSKQMILYNTISLGMIITFVALSGKIFRAFSSLLDANLSLQTHQIILKRFFDFTEQKKGSFEQDAAKQAAQEAVAKANKIKDFELEKIQVQNVFFTYDTEKMILDNVNFELEKGDRIWIEGSNGSGKSTLCKILCMLYEPTKGEVLINDIGASMYDERRLKEKIILVSGEDLIFNNTLLFNVTFGKEVDWQRLIAYTKVLNLYDFINKKEEKFNFILHENGRNLSTGQRRKILLLRALMSDAQVIMLDEIFNGMDKMSKLKAEYLINLIKDKTFIIISHIPIEEVNLNKKYIIKNGKINTTTT